MNELTITAPNVIGALSRAEIDGAIATARAFPRDVGRYHERAIQLVTMNQEIATECLFTLPIDGKLIEGASVRFAEIIASTWGNCRAAARVVEESHEHLTAQGIFHDLENNVSTTVETRRRLIDKKGRRYAPHVVIVTANAACSIALRQAVLRGIPQPFWRDVYAAAKLAAVGHQDEIGEQRAKALQAFRQWRIDDARILNALELVDIEDIGPDELAKLRGLYRAIADGELSPDAAFPPPETKKKPDAQPSTIEEFATMPPKGSKMPAPQPASSAAEAYELGRIAHATGASESDWPGHWWDQTHIEAWQEGWRTADAGA